MDLLRASGHLRILLCRPPRENKKTNKNKAKEGLLTIPPCLSTVGSDEVPRRLALRLPGLALSPSTVANLYKTLIIIMVIFVL